MSGFKLDTNKLMKNIEKQSIKALNKRKYDVDCPHCHKKIQVPAGKSNCIHCGNQIDLNLDISFK